MSRELRFTSSFKEWVKNDILKSPFITVLFDESFNKTTHQSEMDLFVGYWDVSEKRVVVRYWNSVFLGHTTHLDLLKSFNEGLEGLDLSKLVQVSMDGPNTNLKFLQELRSLIDIGSCSLHIIHGAFKTGSEATNWKLDKVLKGVY